MMIEQRLSAAPVKVLRSDRATAGGAVSTLEGYGALFDVETVISEHGITFRERIARGAFALTLIEDDARIAFNHDLSRILGRRSAGTAIVREDEKGLFYSVTINPADPAAMSVAAMVQRRDITGSSFRFTVQPEDEEWSYGHAGVLPLRTIRRARVIELGPVAFPAYPQATVTARHRRSSVRIEA